MGHFGNNKNPPWTRGAVSTAPGGMVGQGNPLQQQILSQGSIGAMGASGMVQYQQSQVFQTPMSLQQQNIGMGLQQITNTSVSMNPAIGQQLNPNQLFSQVGAVTYPNPRALNPNAFQTQNVSSVQSVQNATSNTSAKQRVFTGTVTKVHDNFGFVDEDVFFQTTACVKGSNPVVGDRVLVEATFNPNMPFKWNATRIQVLPMSGSTVSAIRGTNTNNSKSFNSVSSAYNAVPPPVENSNGNFLSTARNHQRSNNKSSASGRSRERSRDRDREEDEVERKRRREERTREREDKDKKSPLRRRSRSPKSRRRTRIVPRYMVQIPKIALHL